MLSKKMGHLLDRLKEHLKLEGDAVRATLPDPDYDNGVIYIRDDSSSTGVRRVFQIPRGGQNFEVVDAGWALTNLDRGVPTTNPLQWAAEANQLTL